MGLWAGLWGGSRRRRCAAQGICGALRGGGSIQGKRAPWGRGLFGAPWGPEEQRGAQAAAAEQAVRAVVLVPSKELGLQVVHSLRCMAAFCARQLRVADVCAHGDAAALR